MPECTGKGQDAGALHKELRQPRNADYKRNSLLQVRTQQWLVNTKENIHTCNIIQTEEYLRIGIYIRACNNNEKRP